MILENYELAKAVVFFSEDRIAKAMLFTEFEAVLDGYVPAVEFANKRCEAAYVEIDSALELATAVFFRVCFDRKGQINTWNLPLDQIAAMAQPIPDITLGHFRLASHSQCPIRYFQEQLWEPDFAAGNKHLRALQHFAKNNRLAIRFRGTSKIESEGAEMTLLTAGASLGSKPLDVSASRQNIDNDFQAQIKGLRMQAALAKKESDTLIAKLKKDHEQRIAEYRELFKEKDREANALRESNQQLQQELSDKDEKLTGLRNYYEHKISLAEVQEKELADSLYENFEKEMQAKLAVEKREYEQLLKIRDVEIQNGKEEEASLKQEIVALRQQHQELMRVKGAEFLQEMLAKGISLVNFQPGLGHINLSLEDLPQYMENPLGYVAAQYEVSEKQFRAWQHHYRAPVCGATDANGQFCGENLERCETPGEFQSGATDRCDKHKVFTKSGKLRAVGT